MWEKIIVEKLVIIFFFLKLKLFYRDLIYGLWKLLIKLIIVLIEYGIVWGIWILIFFFVFLLILFIICLLNLGWW